MLVLGGSVFGTIVTIVIPIMFYNRAYSDSFKNLEKERERANSSLLKKTETPKQVDYPFNEQDPLLNEEDDPDKSSQLGNRNKSGDKSPELQRTDTDLTDKRRKMKIANYGVLAIGCSVGLIGFINAIIEISNGIESE